MSIYWDQKNYSHAFKYRMYQKRSLREKLTYIWNPIPGNKLHNHPRSEILFDHFSYRSQKSCGLYWRTHPQEYKIMLEKIVKKLE